jgi:hypothetical protein
VSNDYFDDADWSRLQFLTLGRSALLNAIVDAIVLAFDRFPALARLLENRVSYGTDAGTANAHVVTLPYTFTLTDGARMTYIPGNTNTGPFTCNVNGLGAIAVKDFAGTALTGGEAPGGAVLELIYTASGTCFRIMQPKVTIASLSVNNKTAVDSTDTPGYLEDKVEGVGVAISKTGAVGSRKVRITVDEGQTALFAKFLSGG